MEYHITLEMLDEFILNLQEEKKSQTVLTAWN